MWNRECGIEICPRWLMCTYNIYWRSNILVPVWENITSDPCPGWGNSLLASSQQESTGRSPELLRQSLDILYRYQTRWASDELPHGWGPRESLPTPFFLHVHPAEPVTRRTVQSSGANSAQSALICSRSSVFIYYHHQRFLVLTLVTGPVSLSLMQPCSMRLSDRHVIINLLPSFSSNGRTAALSADECSARGLLRTWWSATHSSFIEERIFFHFQLNKDLFVYHNIKCNFSSGIMRKMNFNVVIIHINIQNEYLQEYQGPMRTDSISLLS